MKGEVLDKFSEGKSNCFLVKINLEDYMESLSSDYQEYEIQREIVNNIYLDNLIYTLLEKKHIPLIVLISNNGEYLLRQKGDNSINISKFKILDGLQRTYRLKSIYDTIKLYVSIKNKNNSIEEMSRYKLAREYSSELDEINSSSLILHKIVKHFSSSEGNPYSIFDRDQWFEVWTNLSPEEEVDKMLILNAGHKPVKTRHQLELLFKHIIPKLSQVDSQKFELIREKEMSSASYSKKRKPGQFHFAHILTALLSFSEGRPLTSNVSLIEKAQSDYFDEDRLNQLMKFDFLNDFIRTLLAIDASLTEEYNELGIKWIGRETSLVGLFAGLGKYRKEIPLDPSDSLSKLQHEIIRDPSLLNLREYEDQRNEVDLGKVNIGTINKNAVFKGIYEVLKGNKKLIKWSEYFKG